MKPVLNLLETALLVVVCASTILSGANSIPVYKDKTRPVDERVEDLLKRMTLEEKIAQMTQVDISPVLTDEGAKSRKMCRNFQEWRTGSHF